jgi:hypothetical protein
MNVLLLHPYRVSNPAFHWVGHKSHQLAGMAGTCAGGGVSYLILPKANRVPPNLKFEPILPKAEIGLVYEVIEAFPNYDKLLLYNKKLPFVPIL